MAAQKVGHSNDMPAKLQQPCACTSPRLSARQVPYLRAAKTSWP